MMHFVFSVNITPSSSPSRHFFVGFDVTRHPLEGGGDERATCLMSQWERPDTSGGCMFRMRALLQSHTRNMFSSHDNSPALIYALENNGRCNIFACTHTGIVCTVSMLNWFLLACGNSSMDGCKTPLCPNKCWHLFRAASSCMDRSWCSELCLHYTRPRQALSPQVEAETEDVNMEVPVSTVNLSCQRILASPTPLKWQSPHKTGLLSRVWWSHTCSWKTSTSPDVSMKCVFHSETSQSWSCTSWSSIGIDFIDLPFRNF